MAEIEITKARGDEYLVRVVDEAGSSEHRVTLSDEQRRRYAGESGDAERLLRESFRFLLEREPKESILARFELPVIERYFPEYREEIGRRLAG